MKELLDECRERLGPAPRRFERAESRALLPRPPAYLGRDTLRVAYRDMALLLERAPVVWGRLVQANEALLAPGKEDLPAVALFSLDPFYDERPDALGDIARGLFALKGAEPPDAGVADFVRAITDERERLLNRPLPGSICEGRAVFYTTFMGVRSHLPHGFLQSGLFPMLAAPAETQAAAILPCRFWSPALAYAWQTMLEG